MGKYSRTTKYEDLRNELQNDIEENAVPKDLSHFANRLNKIDEEEFKEVEKPLATPDPTRVRPSIWMDDLFGEDDEIFEEERIEEFQREKERMLENTQKMAVFNNEYLDESLLDEVKDYNRSQGITTEEQLQEKLLREIRGEDFVRHEPKVQTEKTLIETAALERWSDIEEEIPLTDFQPMEDIPTPLPVQAKFEDEGEFERVEKGFSPTSTFSNNNNFGIQGSDLEEQLINERTAREALLKETTQIKLELDEYKENLNEMEEKFDSSNRMLNFILIVFILICVVVVGVAIYWILLTKGII